MRSDKKHQYIHLVFLALSYGSDAHYTCLSLRTRRVRAGALMKNEMTAKKTSFGSRKILSPFQAVDAAKADSTYDNHRNVTA